MQGWFCGSVVNTVVFVVVTKNLASSRFKAVFLKRIALTVVMMMVMMMMMLLITMIFASMMIMMLMLLLVHVEVNDGDDDNYEDNNKTITRLLPVACRTLPLRK